MKSIITNNSISICSDYATADIENEIIKRNINILLEKIKYLLLFIPSLLGLQKKKKGKNSRDVTEQYLVGPSGVDPSPISSTLDPLRST